MNSDKAQTPKQEQVQEPVGEVFEEQPLEPKAEVFEDLEEQSPAHKVAAQLADDDDDFWNDSISSSEAGLSERVSELTNIGEPTAQSEPAQPLENEEVATLAQTVAELKRQEQKLTEKEEVATLAQTVAELKRQEQELRQKIAVLQETQVQILSDQLAKTKAAVEGLVQEGVQELEQRKQALQISIEQLERRRERIRTEMRTTFAGVSQELAIRVQGFKDYLVGSLQDLASAAEQLELTPPPEPAKPIREESRQPEKEKAAPTPKFAEQGFQEQVKQIRNILDQYRSLPDYYGPPWQLRRTFEPIHAERVSNWFFTQGGRGAIRSMGSRLQNILIASAIISVMHTLSSDRLRNLIIGNTPERLGEWRRGLQDCLGISRADFGPERGIVLFEEPAPLVQKAARLLDQKLLPLIIVDETEDQISLSMLQYPLWLAFAPDPQQMSTYDY